MSHFALALALIAVLAGCQSQARDLSTEISTTGQLALLTNPSQADLQQIKLIIGEALGTHNIRLSQSVFKDSSLLIIERQAPKSLDTPLLFSETELPNHFILLKQPTGCVIEHRQSERQWALENTNCTLNSNEL